MESLFKTIREIFEALAVIDDPVSEEDKAVYLLASFPDLFSMLVTALGAVPEEGKHHSLGGCCMRNKKSAGDDGGKVFNAKGNPRRPLTCHFCKKLANFAAQLQSSEKPGKKHSANKAASLKEARVKVSKW